MTNLPKPSLRLQAARAVSILLHPFLSIGLLVVLSSRGGRQSLLLLVFSLLIGIPVVLFIRRQLRTGSWQNVDASNPSERPALFAVVGLMCAATGAWFYLTGSPRQALGTLGVAAMTLVAYAVLRWTKLSLHLAFGVYAASVLLQVRPAWGLGLMLLMPLLAWSRLTLERHRPSELIWGAILGAVTAAAILFL